MYDYQKILEKIKNNKIKFILLIILLIFTSMILILYYVDFS